MEWGRAPFVRFGNRSLWWRRLLDSPCFLCGESVGLRVGLCASCWQRLPRAEVRQISIPGVDGVIAPFVYRYPLVPLLRAFKYQGALYLAPLLAQGWEEVVIPPGGLPECVVAVPLSCQRWRQRGYNQAFELARGLARHLDCPLSPALRRVRATVPQAGLSREARLENVRGAFHCASSVRGRRVALVDDVLTTGATLEAAAHALRQAGAQSVHAWVVAHAPVADP